MHFVADFTLSPAKLECPACNRDFVAAIPASVSAVSYKTPFETDLHRVYSSPSFRASGIGMCKACGYAWWLKAFKINLAVDCNATAVLEETTAENGEELLRKFALAYVCGKQHSSNHLELGLIALNAAWCARDGQIEDLRWPAIAREELERALRNPSSRMDRGFYQYLLGELCRQQSDFHSALSHFDKAIAGERLPEQLITRQKVQARCADASATMLPPYLVETMFAVPCSYAA